jgi:hypothetical protein
VIVEGDKYSPEQVALTFFAWRSGFCVTIDLQRIRPCLTGEQLSQRAGTQQSAKLRPITRAGPTNRCGNNTENVAERTPHTRGRVIARLFAETHVSQGLAGAGAGRLASFTRVRTV